MYWKKLLQEVTTKSSASRFASMSCQSATTGEKRIYNSGFKNRKLKKEDPMPEQDVSFSRRETECLICFMEGRTASETAKELNLSPRTVEYYAKNMRKKAGCRTKSELIRFARSGDFIRLWDKDAE